MAINASDILVELRDKVAPTLGVPHPLFLSQLRRLEALPIKIEFKGVVDDLIVKSVYFVPASDDMPAALNIEVVPALNVNFARIPPEGTAQFASLCGKHRPWNDNGRCAEMKCWNYVEKHKDDPIPQPSE